MRAVVTRRHGGPEVVEYHAVWPDPEPGPGEVLLRVGACGLNNTDVNTRTGWYSKVVSSGTRDADATTPLPADASWGGMPITFPLIQGADVCGVVVSGDDALMGRRVLVDPWLRDPAAPDDAARATYLGSERDGGFAELVAVPRANVHPVDAALSDVELASFPTAYVTALNMLRRAALRGGETVLVTGASGGVGGALIQLARAVGATPIALTDRAKEARVRASGAAAVVPRDAPDLAGALGALGVGDLDVVADVAGGARFPELLRVLRHGGRYTCAGAIAGPLVELDLRTMYLRDLTLVGATVPPRDAFADLVAHIEGSRVQPLVAASYPLERFHEAQAAFVAKAHAGNIVIDLTGDH